MVIVSRPGLRRATARAKDDDEARVVSNGSPRFGLSGMISQPSRLYVASRESRTSASDSGIDRPIS